MKNKLAKYSVVFASIIFIFSMALAPALSVVNAEEPDPLGNLEELGESSGLPEQDLPELLARIISWIIGIIGIVLVALFVYGGVVYATSAGNEDRIEMGKKIMLYAIIGVLVIAIAFAVSRYVVQALFVD